MKSRTTILLFLILLISLGSISCGDKGGVIHLYTSMPEIIVQAVKQKFEEKYPDMRVEYFQESSSKVSSRIDLEAESPQGLQADLIWGASPSFTLGLIEKGLVQSYDSPEGKKVADKFKDSQERYFGARLISVVIIYNTEKLTKDVVPKNWPELVNGDWKDQIVMADARWSDTALAWAVALANKYGWEYLQALRESEVAILPKNGQVVDRIASGEFPIGISLDYMARNRIKEGAPLGIIYPDDGAVIISSPIAITSTTDRLEGTRRFVDFVLSQEGQQILVEEGSFIPARNDVSYPFNVDQGVTETDLPINWQEVYENEIQIKRQYKKYLID